jgi:pilus assembly protein CpaC
MKKIIISFLMLMMIHSLEASESIKLFIGEIKILEVGSIDRVAVGNSKLISTSILDNGQLLLLAEAEGETTVHIWYADSSESDIEVSVLQRNSSREVMELTELVQGIGDIEVKEVGQKTVLTGTISKTDEQGLELLKLVAESYPGVINLVRKLEPEVSETIFDESKMVYMDVKVTEFKITDTSTLGIIWDKVIAGPSAGISANLPSNSALGVATTTPLNFANSIAGAGNVNALGFFGIASEITSRINLAVQNGNAILLAEPKLSTRSGGTAKFLAGGEVPIETTGTLGSSNVEYKEFGILLNISPKVDDANNILANVSTEVSAIDPTLRSASGVPGFATRKTETDISIRDGQTLVLSGLIDHDISETVDKFPVLGDIPVLGKLFSSTAYRNEDTELVIFVTPTVYDADSAMNSEKVNRREKMIQQFQSNTDLILD